LAPYIILLGLVSLVPTSVSQHFFLYISKIFSAAFGGPEPAINITGSGKNEKLARTAVEQPLTY